MQGPVANPFATIKEQGPENVPAKTCVPVIPCGKLKRKGRNSSVPTGSEITRVATKPCCGTPSTDSENVHRPTGPLTDGSTTQK